MSKGFNEIDQSCMVFENEKNLQKQLSEACDKKQGVKDETDLALSEEKRLQRRLQEVCKNEGIFQIPLMQFIYSKSGERVRYFVYY